MDAGPVAGNARRHEKAGATADTASDGGKREMENVLHGLPNERCGLKRITCIKALYL